MLSPALYSQEPEPGKAARSDDLKAIYCRSKGQFVTSSSVSILFAKHFLS